MKQLLILLSFIVISAACSKNSNSATTQPVISEPNQPTTDFREVYTGDFLVDISMRRSHMHTIYYNDTAKQVKVRFSYLLSDTVKYSYRGEVFLVMPALKMTIMDSLDKDIKQYINNHTWGLTDTTAGKLIYYYISITTGMSTHNTGGFYGVDSIAFLHEYSEPKISHRYSIRGKRIK